jgi:hypothetical protein
MAATLAHEAEILSWECDDVVSLLWPELTAETPEADRAAAALRHVYEWACSHEHQFFNQHGSTETPPGGWVGRWDKDRPRGPHLFRDRISNSGFAQRADGPTPVRPEPSILGLLRSSLKNILHDAGFDAEAIIRAWSDRGWLELDSEGKSRWRTRINDNLVSLVAIKHEALAVVGDVAEDDTSRTVQRWGEEAPLFHWWNRGGTKGGTY